MYTVYGVECVVQVALHSIWCRVCSTSYTSSCVCPVLLISPGATNQGRFLATPTVLHCTVLHSIVLHCTVLHSIALYCTVLHSIALFCTALHCTVLHSIASIELHYNVLHCTILNWTALHHCAALYCTALHAPNCTALCCTVLHCMDYTNYQLDIAFQHWTVSCV